MDYVATRSGWLIYLATGSLGVSRAIRQHPKVFVLMMYGRLTVNLAESAGLLSVAGD